MFSVIIPWCDRDELRVALKINELFFSRDDVEVVVINAGGDVQALRAIVSAANLSKAAIVDLPSSFNRSLCVNIGAHVCSGDFLFILDADITMRTNLFDEARPMLEAGGFVAPARIVESNPAQVVKARGGETWKFLSEFVTTQELHTLDGRYAQLRRRTSPQGDLRTGDGIIMIRRDHFVSVRGMNARLAGWGYEDTDLQLRVQFLLGVPRFEIGEVVHLTHDSSGRDQKSLQANFRVCMENYRLGHYLGSIEDDVKTYGHLLSVARLDSAAGEYQACDLKS